MKLKQYDITGFSSFEVTDSSLKLNSRYYFSKYETEINFEEIVINRFDKLNQPDAVSFYMTIGLGLLSGLILSVRIASGTITENWFLPSVFGALFFYFFAKWLFSTSEFYTIPTSKHGEIYIWVNKPNKKAVDQFITYFKNHAHEALKSKYGFIDLTIPKEPQIRKLLFLKELEIISIDEFEYLKAQLESTNNREAIGFKI